MIHGMPIDELLLVTAIASYVIGALALFGFFLAQVPFLRNLGATLAIIGALAQFAQLVARYEISHIWPLLNLYGSLSLFSAMSVAIFVIFAFRYRLWFAGGFVLALAAMFLTYGVTWNEGVMPPVPSLQSYWAKVHVPIVVTSYAAFLVSFVISALYLVRYYVERRRGAAMMLSASVEPGASGSATATLSGPNDGVSGWLASLPTLPQLDVLVYRSVAVGLPLLTLGIITGALWAKEAWGAYWQWDPKETAALFSWIIYAAYMHLHTRNQWRGLRTSWVSVIGFLSIIFCYLGVNIWISGLHSYKV